MKTYTLLLFLLAPALFQAQDEIYFKNPSFEGTPRPGRLNLRHIMGNELGGKTNDWIYCGPASETAPDIHPSPDPEHPFFGVDQLPYDGRTYMGMITRENNTWEAVGQKLQSSIRAKQTYQLSVSLSRSLKYVSPTLIPDKMADYYQAVILRVWGGNELCSKEELLVETKKISHSDWRKYTLTFQPSDEWNHVIFEAYYTPEAKVPYGGNLLVDDLSTIIPVNQDSLVTDPNIEIDNPEGAEDAVVEQVSNVYDKTKKPVTAENFMDLFANPRSYDDLKEKHLLQHFHFVHTNWTFKEDVSRSGLRLYLMNIKNQEALQAQINGLNDLQMKESAVVLAKASELYFKNQKKEKLTEEESEYFENSNKLFKTTFKKEGFKDQIRKYIETNLTAFQEEYALLLD